MKDSRKGGAETVLIHVFTSNRLEILADALARVLEKPLATPLAKELILVQSKGMER